MVIATGSRARRWPGCETMAGVHVIRTIDDAVALRADLRPGARMVVIGAGFIGAEVASTARKLGLDVTVVEAAATPLQVQLGPTAGRRRVRCARHERHVADLRRRRRRLDRRASPPPQYCCPIASRASTWSTDATCLLTSSLWVSAVSPTSSGLRGSGLMLGNGVLCGANGQTATPERRRGRGLRGLARPSIGAAHRVEHWTGALERPAIAVATLLAGGIDQGTVVKPPYFWSDQYGSRIQFAGLARPDDEITIEEGSCDDHCFLATYRRDGRLVAVLGVDQPRLFTRWRRQLATAPTVV